MFFVLSGFLITRILIKSRNSTNYFKNFYVRRILRILPAYYLFLFVFFFICPRVPTLAKLFPIEKSHFSWHLLFVSNLLFSKLSYYPGYIVDVSWSLSIEEQFYIFWPLMVWRLSLKQLRWTCLFLLLSSQILICFEFLKSGNLSSTYFFTLTRWDGILVGSALAASMAEPSFLKNLIRHRTTVLRLSLCLSVVAFTKGIHTSSPLIQILGFPSLAVFFGCLISKLTEPSSVYRFFAQQPLMILGKYSYGLYLFHKPIVIILNKVWMKHFHFPFFERIPDVTMLLFQIISVLASLLFALVLFRLYERPFLKLKEHFQ